MTSIEKIREASVYRPQPIKPSADARNDKEIPNNIIAKCTIEKMI